ncbi:cyclic nucleotide-binding domain-containing protein [Chloropicon primus]|nr:cyclic nucleotide-binding domain-containing protein [Chloropicon primus]
MASSDEDMGEVQPPPGGSGVPVLQRLRALSYGSKGQFNGNNGGAKETEPHRAIEAAAAILASGPKEVTDEDESSDGGGAQRGFPATYDAKGDDFEAKYYSLQNKYLDVQKKLLSIQKENDGHSEESFKEIEKLQFESQKQKVELHKTRKENERLHTELADAQNALRQKNREISKLKDDLIESGALAMQSRGNYPALPAPAQHAESPKGGASPDPGASAMLKEKLGEAQKELASIKQKSMQQDLKVKNLENELKHKTLDSEAKTKRQNDLLSEVQDLRMSNVQKKKEVDVLEREIEMMLSEKWNSQHYTGKKQTDFDAPSEGVRFHRLNETIKACKEEGSLLRAQLKEKEREMATLSAALSDTRRMAKVTEDVLKKKIAQLKTGEFQTSEEVKKVELSLRRSVDGLVKALEEQEDKTEQLETELKSTSSVLEAVDKLDEIMKKYQKSPERVEEIEPQQGGSRPYRVGEMMYLPSSARPTAEKPSEMALALSRRNIKKSRRKTIIPVLARLPGAASSPGRDITTDQKFEVLVAIQQIPFLKAMDTSLQRELAEEARLTQCCAGETLIKQGETGSEAFILLEGLLEVFTTIEEQEEVLKVVKPGAIIGEIALLKKEPRNTSVRSITDSRLFVLQKQSLDAILATHPEYRGGLEELASQRQKENQDVLKYKYALSTNLAAKEDLKSAILEDIITEPATKKVEAKQETATPSQEKSQREGKLFLKERLAILRACEATLKDLYDSKEELLGKISELDKASVDKVNAVISREDALKEDLKNVNAEISDIKNELFATCKELEDREDELCVKEDELEALKGDLETIKAKKREEEEKVKKEQEDMLELKRKYDMAAKAETDIIERTQKLWSTINSKQRLDEVAYQQKKRDAQLLQKLKCTKEELTSFQDNLVFLDGKTIPPSNNFNIVVTPKKASAGDPTFFEQSGESDRHLNNLRMIDDLIDQIK